MLRLLQKMLLFLSKLRKMLDAIFGFGDEVISNAFNMKERKNFIKKNMKPGSFLMRNHNVES